MGMGGAGLKMLQEPLNKAMEYERYLAKMRQMGLGADQVSDAQKFVEATKIINTSMMDRMRIFTEAQGAFRESGKSGAEALEAAKTMTPALATYEVAMATLSGEKHAAAENAMRSLNKTVETMGGINDTKRAQDIVDGAFKAVQSSGKMVDERQLKLFITRGASAVNQLSTRTIFGALEPIIGEYGGEQVATGLQTAYSRTNGTMSLPPRRMLEEMRRLGMTDGTGKQQTKELAQMQAEHLVDYVKEMMRRYSAAGITSQTDRERENSIIFGRSGSKIYNKLMSQMLVIEESLQAYDKAQSASDVVNDPANKKLMLAQELEKKYADLQLELGRSILPIVIPAMESLNSILGHISEFAQKHQDIVRIVGIGFALLSFTALVVGALALLAGPFLLLGGTFGIVVAAIVAATAAAIELAANWDAIKSAMSRFGDWLLSWIHRLGDMMPSWLSHPGGEGGSSTVPMGGKQVIVVKGGDTYLDGRIISKAAAKWIADDMGNAPTSGSGFDGKQALMPVLFPAMP